MWIRARARNASKHRRTKAQNYNTRARAMMTTTILSAAAGGVVEKKTCGVSVFDDFTSVELRPRNVERVRACVQEQRK